MRASGAHRHVAALHLGSLQQPLPALTDLVRWPYLHTLAVASGLPMQPGLGSSLAQLTQLQSLCLEVLSSEDDGGYSTHTLHGSHLQQLAQLTSLSLGIQGNTHSTAQVIGSMAALPQLRKLSLQHSSQDAREGTSALASVLPSLTALTSLDADFRIHDVVSHATSTVLVTGIAALPTLQHLGLPRFMDIGECARSFSSLTALTSLHLHDGALETNQKPAAAQLLSRLARLQLSCWSSFAPLPEGRASWLAQLREVTVESVHLNVLADLPPDVCIKAPPLITADTARRFRIYSFLAATTEQKTRESVARLLNSPAVTDAKNVLYVYQLQPGHSTALKPLAEAVSCVRGLHPHNLQHMSGWQLKCVQLDVTISRTSELPQFVQAVLAVEGLCVESLEIHWGYLQPVVVISKEAVNAVQQLCQGLQGLRLVVTSGPRSASSEETARCSNMRQELLQGLLQAFQGRGIEVRMEGSLE